MNFKSKALKRTLIVVATVLVLIAGFAFYQKKVRYNLVTISENKVYNSGVIAPEKLPEVLGENHIKQ